MRGLLDQFEKKKKPVNSFDQTIELVEKKIFFRIKESLAGCSRHKLEMPEPGLGSLDIMHFYMIFGI